MRNTTNKTVPGWLALLVAAASQMSEAAVSDKPFLQEIHQPCVIGDQPAMNDVRAVAADQAGNVWAATGAGAFRLDKGARKWFALMKPADAGPTFDVTVDDAGTVWIGAWNGLYRSAETSLQKIDDVTQPIAIMCATQSGLIAIGPDGLWRVRDGKAARQPLPCARSARDVIPDQTDGLWIATDPGLYHWTPAQTKCYQMPAGLISARTSALACAPDGTLWVGGLGGVTLFKDDKALRQFTPKDGLPSADVRCVRLGPDGRIWAGTPLGVARYDGQNWSLRHSKRWLVGDDVRDVSFDADATAWIATDAGVSAIRQSKTSLADKAEHYLDVCMARHVREPGLVEKCWLEKPGDLSTWKPQDDDNDGQYTSMYLAMESFRYAATKDPAALANARKAFEALRFLQTVTGTPGFVARTVIPAAWTRMADPNKKLTDRELAVERVRDPRYKYVPVRWRPSADGKWLWKGDTSSDEITGHFYGYLMYYDLAADETERRRVADHVRRVMDGLIDAGYVLKDLDGKHTRWAVWSPEKLNGDPDWQFERGINSVEILSFLKGAYRMTGDGKYQRCYLDLLAGHDYKANVRYAKSTDPGWRTHIDEELLALAYPALLLHETDPDLKRLYRASLDHWYAQCKGDRSPYFDFTYASLSGTKIDLAPALHFLRDAPLDLIRWQVDNSKREDLRVVRAPELEEHQTDRLPPISERGVMRWDNNPWQSVQGDAGHTESDGVYWLLPYWMGRYYGFIDAPK
ncbi:MAG: regulator [Phycisphaerae bacterium]|nr:regulator [Phycisphaerae bacterium]